MAKTRFSVRKSAFLWAKPFDRLGASPAICDPLFDRKRLQKIGVIRGLRICPQLMWLIPSFLAEVSLYRLFAGCHHI